MKTNFFSLAISALLLSGLMVVTSSCEQSEMGPEIHAESIETGICCGDIVQGHNEREVQVILDGTTAGFYCTPDRGLTYEFTSTQNPDYVMTETTSEVDPTFCVGAGGDFNLVITHYSASSHIYSLSTVTCQP